MPFTIYILSNDIQKRFFSVESVELLVVHFCIFADCAMSPETAIIGDGSSVFRCGGNCIQKNSKNSVAGVALLFMRDRDKPNGTAYLVYLRIIFFFLVF